MTFQPSESDLLVSSTTWVENHDPFTISYDEKIYSINGGPTMCKVVNKKTSGPEGPMRRLSLSKFGVESTDRPTKPTEGQEVFFESMKEEVKEWVPNGMYLQLAYRDNWSDADVRRIIKSDRPDKVYLEIYRQKLFALQASGASLKSLLSQRQSKEKTINNSISARLEKNGSNTNSTLFIENIPDEYSESNIKDHIKEFNFRRVNIVRRNGESIGKAFIELSTNEEAKKCLSAIHNQRWLYCIVQAQISRPKIDK